LERKGECVGLMSAEPKSDIGSCGFASLAEELEHSRAYVYRVGVELRVAS